jgi:hypothetical protein
VHQPARAHEQPHNAARKQQLVAEKKRAQAGSQAALDATNSNWLICEHIRTEI